MAKIKKIIENGGIQYPATITDAVKNPNNGKTVTEELSELGSKVVTITAKDLITTTEVQGDGQSVKFIVMGKVEKEKPIKITTSQPITGTVYLYENSSYSGSFVVLGRFENSSVFNFYQQTDGYIRITSVIGQDEKVVVSLYSYAKHLTEVDLDNRTKEINESIKETNESIKSVSTKSDLVSAFGINDGDKLYVLKNKVCVFGGEYVGVISDSENYNAAIVSLPLGVKRIKISSNAVHFFFYSGLPFIKEKDGVYGETNYIYYVPAPEKETFVSVPDNCTFVAFNFDASNTDKNIYVNFDYGLTNNGVNAEKLVDDFYVVGQGESITYADFHNPLFGGCVYRIVSSQPITGTVYLYKGNKQSGEYTILGRYDNSSEIVVEAPHAGTVKLTTYLDYNSVCQIKVYSVKKILCIGDSHTFGSGGTETGPIRLKGYASLLAGLSKIHVANAGYPGDDVTQIAARCNSMPYYFSKEVTLKGDGSYSVVGTFQNSNIYSFDKNSMVTLGLFSNVGKFIGRSNPCYIIKNGEIIPFVIFVNSNTNTANPTDEVRIISYHRGNDIAVDNGTPFYTLVSKDKDSDVVVLFQGSNGKTNGQNLIDYNNRIYDYFKCKKVLAVSYPHYDGIGLEALENTEKLMAREYGAQYFNLRRYLITDALKDAGLTPTETDSEYIALGKCPPQLLSNDGVHFNETGHSLIAMQLYKRGKLLRYWE